MVLLIRNVQSSLDADDYNRLNTSGPEMITLRQVGSPKARLRGFRRRQLGIDGGIGVFIV